jgi:hypothetical protein
MTSDGPITDMSALDPAGDCQLDVLGVYPDLLLWLFAVSLAASSILLSVLLFSSLFIWLILDGSGRFGVAGLVICRRRFSIGAHFLLESIGVVLRCNRLVTAVAPAVSAARF